MKIYNSATHTKEEFVPHEPGKVSMYTCGPTVYHFAHIGNLRSYIMEDVLEKLLRYAGYDVTRVMNITDVGHLASDADTGEDKMLKGAQREHKTVMEIAQFYTDAFFADCRKLNIKYPDVVQPATGMIGDYIKVISSLIDRGYAYFAGGNVYFDTSKLEKYYVFNDHDEEDLAVGVREGVEEDANEIAQSEAYLGHPWCKYWVHIHHLNTNSGKMSKSKGEFLTVSLLEEKGYDPLVYRFFCLQSHYRKGLVFSWENLDNAKAAYDKLVARVAALSGEGTVDEGAVERFKNDFLEAVGNDLNTSLGVTALYDVLKAGVNDATKRATLDSFDQVLGLELLSHADALKAQQAAPVEGAEEIEALIAKRLEAKRAKNWAEADAIRDQLRAMGVEIKDGKDGTTWTRI